MANRHQYTQLKVREAIAPSMTPLRTPPGLSSYGLNLGAEVPRFYETNGQTITTIACGIPYLFEVPGYTRAWLRIVKDGTLTTFEGEHDLPMPPYTADCITDPGNYVADAYDLITGAHLGGATLTVTPGGSGMSTQTMMILGAAAVLLFMRRK